ncbi:MAG: cytochrome C oxidase subunit IV family protein [Polyangiaceae bacterium]
MADSDKKKPDRKEAGRSGDASEPPAAQRKKRARPIIPASAAAEEEPPRNIRVRAERPPAPEAEVPSRRAAASVTEEAPRRRKPQPERSAANVAEDVAGTHHGPSMTIYFGIFGLLLVLTGVTVAAAFVDLGPFSAPVAVAIAAVKATVVVLYFMHVKYASRLIGLYAASGFLFLAILLGITMSEVSARAPAGPIDPLAPAGRVAPPPTAGHANPPSGLRPAPADDEP